MTTLMLLPGMDGTGELFAPFQAALPDGLATHVVRYPHDLPLDYPALQRRVQALLPDDDFVMLAESFSGPIAIALAAARPARLRGLILCATFVRNPRPLAAPLRMMLNHLPLNAIPPHLSTPVLLGDFATDDLVAALQRTLAPVSTPVLRARLRAALSVDVSEQMAQVRVPVLYLRAKRDRVVPESAATEVRLLCRQAKVVDIDAPHFVLQTQPGPAAEVVHGFVREVSAAG